ncbi:MAG TPA: DNA-directed RNA polymerase subunit alpha C-terminal domain-containing protein [Planctomycetaceae bacterium]|nr:DNA-directed RNA polymerase subunit alpha C-terminal domain-containing protein [Planctomycetaceae bacterium]
MIRPGVAAPIQRGIAPLAPTDPIDARALIFDLPEFGPQEVALLRQSMTADGLSTVRQAFGELRDQVDDPNPPQKKLVVAGVVAYLLGQQHLALKYLGGASGVGIADYYRGMVLLGQQQYTEAAQAFEEAGQHGYDPIQCRLSKAGAIRLSGKIEEAERLLRESAREAATRAEYSYQMGCIRADHGDIFGAIEYFERTVDMDPHHTAALFRLANEMNLLGNDDDAIRLYEQSLSRPPYYIGALINLGLLYEDKERYPAAAFCFNRVLQFYPNHERAQLYLKDIQAAGDMYYDEDAVRHQRELEQVMRIPIGDFELSARSRNCLERAGIETLGDLTAISEHDLLSSKNFGETSLREIRDILKTRGLSIGQFAARSPLTTPLFTPEAVSPQEQAIIEAPVGDLNLSVRARKCISRLGLVTIGELLAKTADELLSVRNFGVTSLNEVRAKLTEMGLRLRND